MSADEFAPLLDGAASIGLRLTPAHSALFARYRDELLDWNKRVNLTAITAPSLVLTRHFLDALTVTLALSPRECEQPLRVIDVGAGAGLPGLALNILYPHWRVTEVDSVGKKTRFIEHAAATLGLESVSVLTARAEDLAREPAHRESYDLCVARGLAPLRVLAEYTLPFCRLGGVLVAMKKGDMARELEEGRRAVGQVGGQIEAIITVPELPDLGGNRVLVVCRKARPTQPDLPRAAGVPAKRPL